MMLAPDLLDRRALALIAVTDPFGRAVHSPVTIVAAGVRVIAKQQGRIAVLEAPGLAAHSAMFEAAPATPALRSRQVEVDLTPADRRLLPRRHVLRLPRDPDPAQKDHPLSLFQPEQVMLSAAPNIGMEGNACIVRVSVRRSPDGACVENALVRAQAEDDASTAWALSDPAGEAALVFPALPIAFAGPGGTTTSSIAATVVVHVDPANARFTDPRELAQARRAAAARFQGHADPEAIAVANPPDFTTGATVELAAGTQPSCTVQWTAP